MKILLLAIPRSRSLWTLNTLSANFDVPNLYEPYREQFALPHDIPAYQKITESLSKITDGVMKLETTQLTDRHNKNKLIDLNVFDWESFDKIYTITRTNNVDMICSLRIAMELDRWVYTPDSPPSKVDPIVFNPIDKKSRTAIYSGIMDKDILSYVHKWLEEKRISYIPLTYETVIDYAKENWGNVEQNQFTATEYDYSTIFINYNQISEYIEMFLAKYPNRFTI